MKRSILGGLAVALLLAESSAAQHFAPEPRAGSISGSRTVHQGVEGPVYADGDVTGEFVDEHYGEEHFGGCGGCGTCGTCDPSRLWFQADALLWTTSEMSLPTLATTSPSGTSIGSAGVLGVAGTSVVLGNEDVNDDSRLGGRFTLGYLFDTIDGYAIQTSFLFLEDSTDEVSASSDGSTILARPFFDVSAGVQRAQILAFPAVAEGSISVDTFSEIAGSETMIRRQIGRGPCKSVDMMFGYRYFRLDEGVEINDRLVSTATGGTIVVGTTIEGFDSFETENEFHGGQFALAYHHHGERWSAHLVGKVALGNMNQTLIVDGRTRTTVPNAGSTVVGAGLLAQRSNIGEHEVDDFAVIPEFGFNLSYSITPQWTARAGYTFMYISNVLRPEEHIDLAINPTQTPGPTVGVPAPNVHLVDTDYWLQGINLGLEYRF